MAAVLLLGFLVGYPLSVGPSIFQWRASGRSDRVRRLLVLIYAPLEFLPKPVQEPLENWVEFWDELGDRY